MKKKIILTVLLGLLIGLGIYCCVNIFSNISYCIKEFNYWKISSPDEIYRKSLIHTFVYSCLFNLFFLSSLIIEIIIIVKIWNFHTKIRYSLKYSYEEYKEKKQLKQLEKKEKKKQRLAQKLKKLD